MNTPIITTAPSRRARRRTAAWELIGTFLAIMFIGSIMTMTVFGVMVCGPSESLHHCLVGR